MTVVVHGLKEQFIVVGEKAAHVAHGASVEVAGLRNVSRVAVEP